MVRDPDWIESLKEEDHRNQGKKGKTDAHSARAPAFWSAFASPYETKEVSKEAAEGGGDTYVFAQCI